MQRHKKAVAKAVAQDGWVWPVGSVMFAGSVLTLWTMLH